MSKNHDADKVRDGSTSDENDGSRGVVDGGEVPVSVEPAALNQVDAADLNGGVSVAAAENVENDTKDTRMAEDGGREDMFVDCPDVIESPETPQYVEESNDAQDSQLEGLSNGAHDLDWKAEVEHLRKMLNDSVAEKDRIAREAEEERAASMYELTRLNNQLKDLIDSRSLLNKDDSELVENLHHSEAGVRDLASGASLHEVVTNVSKFLKEVLDERVQAESRIRELNDMIHMKNQEIDALNSKVSEFSMERDVALSNLNSEQENSAHLSGVQLEKEHHITEIANEILASLASAVPQEEFSDESVTGKMYHVKNRISFLVEKYNVFLSEVDQLRWSLTEVAPDHNMQDEMGVLVVVRDTLAEFRKREVNLNQHLSFLSDENGKLSEELNKHKLLIENANAEITKLNAEIEQERTRYANIKEKLSLAVTKGKALVQQRDALKQSLSEKTSELERYRIELQEKSNSLEAAEQTKDLLGRSENLAASLQEALIQKEMILQKCEEILSKATGSEQFQSTDTIEKVKWLADEMNALNETSLQFQRMADSLSLFDFPQPVLSYSPDARVAWLLESFSLAKEEVRILHEQIGAAKEAANNEIGQLIAFLVVEAQDKSYLQGELEDLNHKYAVLAQKEHQATMDKGRIISMLLEASKINTHDHELVYQSQSDMTVLFNKCVENIKEESSASLESYKHQFESFEQIQSNLYIRDMELRLYDQMLTEEVSDKAELNRLSNHSVKVTEELCALKEEKESLEKNLEQYEDKVSLLREKLSMAVKKGKGLVQEREKLKGALDEKSAEIEKLKSDLHLQESLSNDQHLQIDKLEMDRIPQLEADLVAMKDQRDQLEQFLVERNNMLQKVIESLDGIVLPADLGFQDPIEKVKWISGYLSESQTANMEVEQELGRVKNEASSLASKLLEVQKTIKSLEDALSAAENKISQLLEDKSELEAAKELVEKELEKAMEEASAKTVEFENVFVDRKSIEDALSLAEKNVLVLKNEKEEALLGKDAAESELQKIKEEFFFHTNKLKMVDENIQSLEDALVQAEKNISLLTEENNRAQVGRVDLENELNKLKGEADIQNSKLSDAFITVKSLEDALLNSENKISNLINDKKNAEEEIVILTSKVDACMQELAGSQGSVETKVLEISTHLSRLQLLLRDEDLFSSLRKAFEEKFESLKDMDLLLKEIWDSFSEVDTEVLPDSPTKDDSSFSIPSVLSVVNDALNEEVASGEPNATDGDSVTLHLGKIVDGFQLRNKILAENIGCYSALMDDLIKAILKKLELTKSKALPMIQLTESLKQKVRDADSGRLAQENTIQSLERDLKVLLSAFKDATNELALTQSRFSELGSNFDLEKLKETSPEQFANFGEDAIVNHHLELDSSQSAKTAEKLLLAARQSHHLTEQFKTVMDVMVGTIKDLQVKLEESNNTCVEVLEEKEIHQERISHLETNLEELNDLCNQMKLKLEDYQAKEDNIKEKEAELLSLNAKASLNYQEAEDLTLSASHMRSLFDKLNEIETLMGPDVGDAEAYESPDVRRLFYVVDSFPRLQLQMSSLSREKKELQSSLEKQMLQIENLKEEVEEYIRDEEDYTKMKDELLEFTIGLENIIQKLGSNNLVNLQKETPVTGFLPVLDKLIVAKVLESENLKAKTEELLAELHGTQKVVEDLSSKVKSLENSNQLNVTPLEINQERGIFEAASLPTQSEISEVQDVVPVSKNLASSSVTSAAHVRTLRKGSADQLTINIDSESERLINEEEADQEKGHAFKSLNTSGLIPGQGKMIADRIDGIWVSSSRALMSHPRGRLSVIAYCMFLHIWLLGTIL
ncbi:trans-Golgi network-localized SYP41-interacting protein 1 [Solanum dulcamara]|uniref:trans-Golgi network-localized SYP41-interacting protein 1 n=1 Tax=Solanum dulcamara TaxID=45834 RepID=UPI0024862E92|nr:trans-Golgi network-localized SYP41-interacting protein 1 [Solanum dulcamara]XP_055810433.1 trans-Golgi network-localized SYP41-interacting protein 1 [Solanum dulcamara]XP_055810434.1 trans-Golgi network-localized SYP41-interacting protein 1 [Solanum dulcamara]